MGVISRCSIVVSIPACHAGDPGSIPGNGVFLFVSSFFGFISTPSIYISIQYDDFFFFLFLYPLPTLPSYVLF